MNFFKKYKKMIMILTILIIATVAYTLVVGKTDKNLLISESSINTNSALQDDLLALLLDIRSIKLDEDILSDTAFRSLEDFGQEILPESVGRDDPFAPVNISKLSIDKPSTETVEE